MKRIERGIGRRGLLVAAVVAVLLVVWVVLGVWDDGLRAVVERVALAAVILAGVVLLLEARRRQMMTAAAVRKLTAEVGVLRKQGVDGRGATQHVEGGDPVMRLEEFARHAIATVAAMERLSPAQGEDVVEEDVVGR